MNTVKILKKVYPVFLGAAIGFAYYYFIGCTTGTCPIQSSPYLSTAYGAVVGAAFLVPGKKKKKNIN